MKKDINSEAFDRKTMLKLDLFRECFREWFPVFLHNNYIEKVYIMDMFAGSGTDSEGNMGSPLILLDEVKGKGSKFCQSAHKNKKDINFWFNESNKKKTTDLKQNIKDFFDKCRNDCSLSKCYHESKIKLTSEKFGDIFSGDREFLSIMKNKRYGKFLFIDQYGFKEVSDIIFKQLIEFPCTDFIFFISSSYIKRFIKEECISKYFKSINFNFNEKQPKEIHREVANYFRNLIPEGKEYYLHHFGYLKKTNYYGLIFGSAHTYGMEKFLKVCWHYDPYSGESSENIDNDFLPGELFYDKNNSYKKDKIREDIKNKIRSGEITNNVDGLKYAIRNGCQGNVFTKVMEEFVKMGNIEITSGKFNLKSSMIHTISGMNKYTFKWKENENN